MTSPSAQDGLPSARTASSNATAYDRELLRRQVELLRGESATRARLESEIAEEFARETATAKSETAKEIEATREKHRQEIEATRKEYEAVTRRLASQGEAEQRKIDEQRKTKAAQIQRACEEQATKVREDHEFEKGSVKEVFKEKQNDPHKLLAKWEKELARTSEEFEQVVARSREMLAKWGVKVAAAADQTASAPDGDELLEQIKGLHTGVLGRFTELKSLDASKTIFGGLKKDAAQKATDLWTAIERDAIRGRKLLPAAAAWLPVRRDEQVKRMESSFRQNVAELDSKAARMTAELTAKRDAKMADLEEQYRTATETIRTKVGAGRTDADSKYPARITALETALSEDIRRREQSRDERLAAAAVKRQQRHAAMTAAWRQGRSAAADVFEEASRIDAASFAPWSALADGTAALPEEAPPGLRFGQLAITLAKVPGGVSEEPELNAFGPLSWLQPAAVPFPAESSVLVKTTADQKEEAAAFLQALTLRIASGVPAGQTRFTIIDPLGLGKHFAGFMHLADYDELLVTSRIWTEPAQIEQRLADITEQMELVIQKYLRNEYESIGAYNADAEVPEPYRFVVVSGFPANFTETSARRLSSIASSGARCGVYTIVSVDTKQAMPANFSLADIE